jgi:hypothetical protein
VLTGPLQVGNEELATYRVVLQSRQMSTSIRNSLKPQVPAPD